MPTAIITGASSGIGRALALFMAEEGYDLGLMARRRELLESLQSEIVRHHPKTKVKICSCNVANTVECRETIFKLAGELKQVDVFVANAGVGGSTPGGRPCWEESHKILDTNVVGAICSLECAKEIMLQQKSGHLVGLSSIAAVRGLPQSSAYCMSRAAVAVYLESLRVDLKARSISVTSIHPGFVDTPMTREMTSRPFLVSVEQAAKEIFWAIQHKKARHYFPWMMRFVYPLLKHLPDSIYDWILSFRQNRKIFSN